MVLRSMVHKVMHAEIIVYEKERLMRIVHSFLLSSYSYPVAHFTDCPRTLVITDIIHGCDWFTL